MSHCLAMNDQSSPFYMQRTANLLQQTFYRLCAQKHDVNNRCRRLLPSSSSSPSSLARSRRLPPQNLALRAAGTCQPPEARLSVTTAAAARQRQLLQRTSPDSRPRHGRLCARRAPTGCFSRCTSAPTWNQSSPSTSRPRRWSHPHTHHSHASKQAHAETLHAGDAAARPRILQLRGVSR